MAVNVRTAVTLHKLVKAIREQPDDAEPLTRAGLALVTGISYPRVSALVTQNPELFEDNGLGISWTGNPPPDLSEYSRRKQEALAIKRQTQALDFNAEMLRAMQRIADAIEKGSPVGGKTNAAGIASNTAEDKADYLTLPLMPTGLIKRMTKTIESRKLWQAIEPVFTSHYTDGRRNSTPVTALDKLCMLVSLAVYFSNKANVDEADKLLTTLLKRSEAAKD